jgi:hypothetical protein
MLPFADPLDFVRHSTSYSKVRERFDEDMQHAQRWMPARQVPGAIVMVLPDAPWAKRTNGVLANQLMRSHPDCAIAVLLPKACGGFTASVRVPAAHAVGAADFCRIFETGGGRRLAAGINHLPDSDVRRFTETFESQFCVS